MSPSLLSTLPPELMPVTEGIEGIQDYFNPAARQIKSTNAKKDNKNKAAKSAQPIKHPQTATKASAKKSDTVAVAVPNIGTSNAQPKKAYVALSPTAKDAVSMTDNQNEHSDNAIDNEEENDKSSAQSQEEEEEEEDTNSVHTVVSVDDITAAVRASGLTRDNFNDAASDSDIKTDITGTNTVNARITGASRFRGLLGGRTSQIMPRSSTGFGDLFTRNKMRRHPTVASADDVNEPTEEAVGRSAWGLSRLSRSKEVDTTPTAPAANTATKDDNDYYGAVVVARKSAKEHGISAWRRAAPLRMLAQRIVGLGQRFTSAR
ncbi:hypothetical protein BDF19DRAFT_415555 [Syncephalis fuscata]|nr:hypothetical protein BDF19DRAFT_415555 [Syncephalis fuscata]